MLKRKPLSVAIATAIGVASASGAFMNVAYAADDESMMEEVVVTGSRIKRQDFDSNAPVATIGSDQFDLTGTINTESLLNTMPQIVPGLDRTSNNPGNGTATVDLRGLGSNRTLVLINGTRANPTSQGGSVDINNIPTALIDRVEVLTGGASAIYGSDAVAGVINFILKDDFEGVQFNISTEQTSENDAGLTSADLTLGVNSGDGRGNVVFNVSWTDRESLFQGDRKFAFFAQFDDEDADGNPILIDGGSSGIPSSSIFAGALCGYSADNCGVTFDQNGAIRPFETGSDNDFYNYAPVNYIQLPQERYQATTLGRYEIAESAEVYGRVMYTSSRVPQELAPTPIFQPITISLDGNPFLSGDSLQVLHDAYGNGVDTDGNGIDDTADINLIRRRLLEVGPRIVDSRFISWQIQAGVRGDIGDSSWSYDAYVQSGSVEGSETQHGNVNRDRFNQALLLDLAADPTGGTCMDASANGSTVGCSPINIFGQGNISEQGAAFLRTAVSAAFEYDQELYSITFTGDVFELPAGTVGVAVGYEHIQNSADFRPSQDLAAGTIAGFNSQPPSSGSYTVSSYYAEAFIPLLKDVPFAQELELELAYRKSDYSTVGNVSSYKIAGSWSPIDSVRFRAGFNTAVRAPSIGELFSPASEGFPGSADPCAAEGNPDAATAAICTATGVASADVGSVALNLAAGQVRAVGGGNPNLQEEEAETLTYGVVITPSFLEGLTLSIDRFDIEIEEYIATFGGGANNILSICYDPTDPNGGAGSAFCNVVNRRADGTIEFIETSAQNVAVQTLKGWDLLATYDMELFGGDFQVSYVGTFTDEDDFVPFTGGTTISCDGEYGNDCGEPRPDYKHRMTFNWSRDNITAQLLWRHIGEVKDDNADVVFFKDKIGGEDYFDIVASYRFTENYSVLVGIDNVADTSPPILGDNQQQANTWPATYDVFGRTYYVKATARF
ncbi:MAG: TonB-dependent receptor [Pseudomonadales bacterium]